MGQENEMGWRWRLGLAALAAACCAVPLAAGIGWGPEPEGALPASARAELEDASAEGAQRLDDWYASTVGQLKTMSRIPGLMSMDRVAGREELMAYAKAMPWVRVVFASEPSGMQVLRTDADKPIDISARPYYKPAFERGLARLVSVSPVTGASSFFVVAPLAEATGGAGGLIAVAIDLNKVSQVVVDAPAGAPGVGTAAKKARDMRQVFVADEKGKLMAHSAPGAVEQPKKGELAEATAHPLWAKRPRQGLLEIESYVDAGGRRWVGAMRQSNLGWYVGVEIPWEAVAARSADRRGESWVALALAAACAAALGCACAGWGRSARGGWEVAAPAATSAVLCVAVPAAGFLAWQGEAWRAAAREEAQLRVSYAAERSARRVQSWMDANHGALAALSNLPGIALAMKDPEIEKRVMERMRLVGAQLPWIRTVYLIRADGTHVARTDGEKLLDVSDRPYFKRGRVEAFGQQVAVSRTSFRPTLFSARALKDAEGRFLGEVVFAMDVDAISAQVASERMGAEGARFVMDKEGKLMAHTDPSKAKGGAKDGKEAQLVSYADHPLWKGRPGGADVSAKMAYEVGGREFVGAVARADDFQVGAELSVSEVDAPSDARIAELARVAMLGALVAAALAAAAWLGGRSARERAAARKE